MIQVAVVIYTNADGRPIEVWRGFDTDCKAYISAARRFGGVHPDRFRIVAAPPPEVEGV